MRRRKNLDTDALSLWQRGHAAISAQIAQRAPAEIATTVITVQEQLDGWHSRLPRAKNRGQLALIYQSLADSVHFLAKVQILSFTEPAIDRYEQLIGRKLNVGKMDLRIAAIVLENDATLVSRNLRDFRRVPGLRVEDWTV